MVLLLLFPFLELTTLISLGRMIGMGFLFLYVLGTFFLGMNLVRSAGVNSLRMGAPSTVLEAPFRLMAGVLILIPGLISDVLALLILIPLVRKILWVFVVSKLFQGRVVQQTWSTGARSPFQGTSREESDIVDVTGVRVERDVTPLEAERLQASPSKRSDD